MKAEGHIWGGGNPPLEFACDIMHIIWAIDTDFFS